MKNVLTKTKEIITFLFSCYDIQICRMTHTNEAFSVRRLTAMKNDSTFDNISKTS